MTKTASKSDIYQDITNSIIEALESGVKPWNRPWTDQHAAGSMRFPVRHNGIAYRGINVIALWAAAAAKGYSNPMWMTYRQAQELGGQVRKGEKSSQSVFFKSIAKDDETGPDGKPRKIWFAKNNAVFNVDQIDGLPDEYYSRTKPILDESQRIAHCEEFFAATGARVVEGGGCYYSPSDDKITMVPFGYFKRPELYYSTLGHEVIHWTKGPGRLDRDFGRKRWGDAGYAQEELVAELGAAFLAAELGIELEDREDHAAYIGSWLRELKNDKKYIFQAASHAQKAVDWVMEVAAARQAIAEAA